MQQQRYDDVISSSFLKTISLLVKIKRICFQKSSSYLPSSSVSFFLFQNGFTVLHICARKNQIKLVSILLERGVQADTTTRFGVSPLHLAAQEGNPEIVDMLLEHGSSPGAQTMVNLSYDYFTSVMF